jgi:hypothetical protein
MNIATMQMSPTIARAHYKEYRKKVLAQWDLTELERSVLEGRIT